MTDVIVIGAGPAGMTAAIYALRAGMSVILLESTMYGGQVASTPEVENFPSVKAIAGWELAQNMYAHVKEMGVDFRLGEVVSIEKSVDGKSKIVVTADERLEAKTVIIANGAKRRKMECKGEDELMGMGVSYCASCDGAFFNGKTVAVVGGGNTALEDALYLTNICEKVYLVHRRDEFRGQKHLINAVVANEKIEIKYLCLPDEVIGVEDGHVVALRLTHKESGEREEIKLDGIFVAIGLDPDNAMFANLIELDEYGYIKAGENCHTSVEGVYVAGDSREKPLRQIVTACADGAVAATEAATYIHSLE